MLVPKEVARPGTYFYRDEKTGKPRKLIVTKEMTKNWHDQGNKMLSYGLTVPLPCEHDFNAHPMTPAEKLLNNAGWVKQYEMKGDRLFAQCDILDESLVNKLPKTIRWTSPWINSFTDGAGREWNNVISHLALTTRPRITEQEPFGSVAAALSLATETKKNDKEGFCFSHAGLLTDKNTPLFPIAFSLTNGIKLDLSPTLPKNAKDKKATIRKTDDNPTPSEEEEEVPTANTNAVPDEEDDDDLDNLLNGGSNNPADATPDPANPSPDTSSDIGMEELLCDLLQALGVPMPDDSNEAEFKRHLYEAAMGKIKELAGKAMNPAPPAPPPQTGKPQVNPPKPTGQQQPKQSNPLIQQEQQPMYMSLDDINKIEDSTMRTVALSMYQQNEELRLKLEANEQRTNALQNTKLSEETKKRQTRINMLGRLSPRVKEDLDSMVGLQSMALSLSNDGTVHDPMKSTLDMLEKGLSNMPRLLTTDHSALSVQSQPTDADLLSAEGEAALVDSFSRMMGCAPEKKVG